MEGNIAAVGAGLACLGMAGAGVGVGLVAGKFLEGALRNPGAASEQTGNFFIGMAFAEALGILSFVIAILLALS